MNHTCHAFKCKREVKPELFMCAHHWRRVPAQLKARIWSNYVKGQCNNWSLVTLKYAEAAKAAIRDVAHQEQLHMRGDEPELTLYDVCTGTQRQPGFDFRGAK